MKHDPKADALALWLGEQQQKSRLAQPESNPGELHLHQHHYAAPPDRAPTPSQPSDRYEMGRMHPLMAATYMLFLSVAISLPLALLAAIVDSTHRPSVQYIQPPARW